jgi:hypothetical protein
MAMRRSLLFAMMLTGLGCAAGNPARKTWVTPEREPMDCNRYLTDPYDSENGKIASERRCRIEEQWRAFVTARQGCSVDKDCVLVYSDCPFGCDNVPVAAAHATAVDELQRELWKRLGGRRCKHKCEPVTRTVCEHGWCVGAN